MINQQERVISRLLGGSVVAVAMLGATMLSAGQAKQYKALAWAKSKEKHDNIIPFVWVYKLSTPEKIKAQVDKQPPGYKTIFSWELHRKYFPKQIQRLEQRTGKKYTQQQMAGLSDNPADGSVWWDNGVATVGKRFDEFFKKYHQLGGTMDYFILDFEKGMSNWSLKNKKAVFDKIAQDPRFAPIKKELSLSDIRDVYNWRSGETYLKWNAFMRPRVATYINQAIYAPIKKYYPKVEMSNYNYYYHRQQDKIPGVNGHKSYKYSKGSIVGNSQAPALYCSFMQLSRLKLDGSNKYAPTPFNGFRYSLNIARSAVLASNRPLTPWISHKNYRNSLVRESDLYQELIFHLALTGVDTFLLWNPNVWTKGSDPKFYRDAAQDRLVNDCLTQLNELITTGKRKTLVKNIVSWGADYALTGMQLNGSTIWRFTPRMKATEKISNFISADKSKVVLKTATTTITIPLGKIITPKQELSGQGVWIVAPLNATPVVKK
ncbi:MAG: hypothetical protein L3J71_03930 [Victivallaceae bacterium]|nr:hypothetical protein [Victivallaceae bacterium]